MLMKEIMSLFCKAKSVIVTCFKLQINNLQVRLVEEKTIQEDTVGWGERERNRDTYKADRNGKSSIRF